MLLYFLSILKVILLLSISETKQKTLKWLDLLGWVNPTQLLQIFKFKTFIQGGK